MPGQDHDIRVPMGELLRGNILEIAREAAGYIVNAGCGENLILCVMNPSFTSVDKFSIFPRIQYIAIQL